MTSIRKFAYAALLAVTALNFAPSLASAEEPARGRFTLTHEVRWENAKLPAGDYEFAYDPNAVSPLLTLTKVSGVPAWFMLIVPSREESKRKDMNRLVLETNAEGSYVSAMQLPQCGMTLVFRAPHVPEKQMAKAVNTGPLLGQ
mgnify:CR=1 FL=1